MRNSCLSKLCRVTVLLGYASLAGCSGGGGGTSVTQATGGNPSTGAAIPASDCSSGCYGAPAFSNTGIPAGPIAAPLPASYGAAQGQTATATTPTFDGSNYPSNVTFPLISTSLKAASTGMSAVTSPDATLTISTSANSTTYQFSIPSLGWSTTGKSNENIVSNIEEVTSGFSYVAIGIWGKSAQTGSSSVFLQSATAFSLGYETAGMAMPASGSANFSGPAQAFVYQSNGSNVASTFVEGKANLSVNFSSGQVSGGLTQMQYWTGAPYGNTPGYQPWNDVSLNGNIVPGTNKFGGITAATSAPGTSFSLSGSATGSINGAFYGPAAQNLGAVWSLSDGTKSAIGVLAGKQ